jgi:hypothetical protein
MVRLNGKFYPIIPTENSNQNTHPYFISFGALQKDQSLLFIKAKLAYRNQHTLEI